ncbi:MAG: MgtC/SapB family protein [Bdellovibrio sp.]|nr:MgtC/SapB family protein [Bdellovibrio sp.]
MNDWEPYLIATAVGLLVGIERENSKGDENALGVRTFFLISLLGAVAGALENSWMSTAITVFALGLISLSYAMQIFEKAELRNIGFTTEVAAGLVFAAGYLAHQSPVLAAALGPIVAAILFSKKSLHRFIHLINSSEIKAAITLLLIAVVVIDLAPDTVLDRWGLFNPRNFGYIILTLASLEFSSYVILKLVGEKNGSLLIGFLGGFVSSTAVVLSSGRQATKNPDSWRTFAVATIAAELASLVELLIIIFLISRPLLMRVGPTIAIVILIGACALLILRRKDQIQNSELILKSPLDWKGVLRLSILFALVLVLITVTENWLGHEATYSLSFLTGLFELHGITFANATLFSKNQLTLQMTNTCLSLAVAASLIAKIAISYSLNRGRFSLVLTAVFLAMIAVIVASYFIYQLEYFQNFF